MTNAFFRTAFVAVAVLAGSFGASAAPVVTGPVSLGIMIGDAPVELAQYRRSGCSAGQALRKASRLGIRRARVVRDNRRAVVVQGRRAGRIVTASFAQARSCPVIGIR